MSAHTTLIKFTPIAYAVALGFGMLATGVHASSPILSASNVLTNSDNLGLGATTTTTGPTISTYTTDWYTGNHNTDYATEFTSEVNIAPTISAPGQMYNYSTVTTTKTWDQYTWENDYLSIDVASSGANQTGNKWISLTGSVQSTIDTNLSFNLFASGSFTATAGPFGSSIAPLLASFYFGGEQPTALSAYTSTNLESLGYSTYSSSYSTTTFNLLAGVAQNFVAYVYAPNDVSISYFNLNAHTSNYDLVTTPHTQITIGPKTLLSATIIPQVPEPETYAMMLAGLGLVGAMIRRRTNAVV